VGFVNLTCFHFLWNVTLRYFVTSIVVSFLYDFLKVFKQIDDKQLPSCSAADQDMPCEWMELHGGNFMLGLNGEQRVHLVLAVPEGDFVHTGSAYIFNLLFLHFAVGLTDEEHIFEIRAPKDGGHGEHLVVFVQFDVGVSV